MANYATETEVRLRHGFHSRETYADASGKISVGDDTIDLDNDSTQILSIRLRNGSTVTLLETGTHYFFIEPRTIVLVTAVVANDIFYVEFGSELDSITIEYHLEDATAIVKSFCKDRFGLPKLLEWEVTTPPLIKSLTTQLAGYDAERSMLRNAHKFPVNALEFLDRNYNRILKMLRDIKKGKLDVPEAEPRAGLNDVIRGLDQASVFASLSDLQNVDINKVDADQGTDGRVFD